jgi:hypothetical protein
VLAVRAGAERALIVDEADAFAPQRPQPGQQTMLGAFEAIARRGRIRGLGITLITQRPAVLNKNVLTQVEMLIVLQMTAPQDRAAILEWVQGNGTQEQWKELLASLASLEKGEAWVWSPSWLRIFVKVHIRRRTTFDSSKTPEVGDVIAAPQRLADVDIEALRERLASSIEKTKADDPKALRQQIGDLKRELAAKPKPVAATERVVERVEIPVLTDDQATELRFAIQRMADTGAELMRMAETIGSALARVGRTPPTQAASPVAPKVPPASSSPRLIEPSMPNNKLSLAERKILTVLCQYAGGRGKSQIAKLSGYAVGGGGFGNALGALRSKGYIEGRDPIDVTYAGRLALGSWDPLPTGSALIEHWMAQLGKAERMILQALVDAYPKALSKDELGSATGYQSSGGGFNNALGHLRTLELIDGRGEVTASATLFEVPV